MILRYIRNKRMKKLLLIVFTLPILLACKKDRLVGEYDVFVGEWQHVFTIQRNWATSGTIWDDTLPSSEFDGVYGLQFIKRGKVCFKRNDKTVRRYRTVIQRFDEGPLYFLSSGNRYGILLNNADNLMVGEISNDTIVVENPEFPTSNIGYTNSSKKTYMDFYVRR